MKSILLALLPRLLEIPFPQGHSVWARADKAADAVSLVVEQEVPAEKRESYARLVYTWSRYESFFYANPPGSNDHMSAAGVMQVHEPQKIIDGATPNKVRSDIVLGYRVGVRLLLQLEKKCGSLKGAFTAFSTDGGCHPNWNLDLVKHRFKLAGVRYDG